jgi:hypothetical protein
MGGFKLHFLRRLLPCGTRKDVDRFAVDDLCKSPWDAGSVRPRPYRAPTEVRQAPTTIHELESKALALMARTPSVQSAIENVRELPPTKPRSASKPCRCGETEWCVFMLSFFDKDPFVPVRIVWIPCPVHPCRHSVAEEGPWNVLYPWEFRSKATAVDGGGKCICSSFEQMMAQPEARKVYEEAEARESGRTVPHY